MALYVQKFGGSSLSTITHIQKVAQRVKATREQGHDVVVVVSAMGDQTDQLVKLAHHMSPQPDAQTMDMLLASGEQVSIALLAMALQAIAIPAVAMTGWQAGIQTDDVHTRAQIESIDVAQTCSYLAAGNVVVIAGFQGITATGLISTLGRGGSDATAIALAGALGADECQIYTDVKGVYTADPRYVSNAVCLSRVDARVMLAYAEAGASVLQPQAVRIACDQQVPVRVAASFEPHLGTLLSYDEVNQSPYVLGVACLPDVAVLESDAWVEHPGVLGFLRDMLKDARIDVHWAGRFCVVPQSYFVPVYKRIEKYLARVGGQLGEAYTSLVQISIVGFEVLQCAGLKSTLEEVFNSLQCQPVLGWNDAYQCAYLFDLDDIPPTLAALHGALGLGQLEQIA